MKNFTDLMVEIAKDENLAKECFAKLNETDHSGLSNWLKSKGYDVDENECKKLVDNKDNIKSSRVGLAY